MRDFKFRAWDKNRKVMIPETKLFRLDCSNELSFLALAQGYYEEYDMEIMQYAGIKDKKGTEIYEGDIYHQGDENIRYIVVWNDTGLIGKQIGSSSYAGLQHWRSKIQVIGNIYENPELLK
jgi:hypothetical protein